MSKRGQNEGSIYERADGTWEAKISLGYDATGKRVRKSLYGKTRAEVREKMDQALGRVRRGTYVAERQKVGEYLRAWLEESAKPKVRPTTYATYRMYVERHLIPGLGKVYLDKLTPQQVQAFVNAKVREVRTSRGSEERTLTPRTVQQMHAILRKALNQAMKWGLVERNVATLIDVPRVTHAEIAPLTPDEAKCLLTAIQGNRLEALYTVALACGLRQGEALGLRWQDIDLTAGTLTVRVQLQRIGRARVLVEPKTARSRRTLDLPAICVAALKRHRARQAEERLVAGAEWEDQGMVFTTTRGTPLDGTTVTHYFQQELEKAGIRRQRFHDLRHACASFLLLQGVSPRVVMELLGHSQIGITMNLYTHVMPSLKRDAADRMHDLLGASG